MAAQGGDATATLSRVGRLSRSVVRTAMELLQHEHGLADSDAAFEVLRQMSQRHNVKLRVLADAVVCASMDTAGHGTGQPTPPTLSFSPSQRNRTRVLEDLMQAAMEVTGATHSTVQVRDPVFDGLRIEGHCGFDRSFVDFFSYIDDNNTACGRALAGVAQVSTGDVATSPIYDRPAALTMLASHIHSVVSTPMRDETGHVWGVVSTHHSHRGYEPTAEVQRKLEALADETAGWLRWHSATVMTRVLAALHARAEQDGVAAPTEDECIVAAQRMLMRRYGIESRAAFLLLVRISEDQRTPIEVVAKRLLH